MGPAFRLGPVVVRGFRAWGRDLPLLIGLVAAVNLPMIGWDVYQTLAPDPAPAEPWPEGGDWRRTIIALAPLYLVSVAGMAVSALFARLAEAVVIFAVFRRQRGRLPWFCHSLRSGLARLGPVLMAAVALFAIQIAVSTPLSLVLVILWKAGEIGPNTLELFTRASQLLLLLVLSPFWVAIPVAVIEGRNPLRRSRALTRGRRGAIFAILVLVVALEACAARYLVPALANTWWQQYTGDWITSLVASSLAATFAVVGYRALRVEKENVDATRSLQRVFE